MAAPVPIATHHRMPQNSIRESGPQQSMSSHKVLAQYRRFQAGVHRLEPAITPGHHSSFQYAD